MKKDDYLRIVNNNVISNSKIKNYFLAFFSGGLIGLGAEILNCKLFTIYGVNSSLVVMFVLIFLSCLFTSLGFMDSLVKVFQCGIIIPITGFAHSITSSTLEYKKDGLITGIGANIFKLAGSVILYGTVSGIVCGVLKVIVNV